MNALRIVHIIPSLVKGGAERLTLDICASLQQQGCSVKLILLHPDNMFREHYPSLEIECCESYVIPSVSGKSQINVSALQSAIDAFQPDEIGRAHV